MHLQFISWNHTPVYPLFKEAIETKFSDLCNNRSERERISARWRFNLFTDQVAS
jgi:hypothetical protein